LSRRGRQIRPTAPPDRIEEEIAVRSAIRTGLVLAAAVLLLGLSGCGVFCSGAGTNGWAGGACGTTMRF